MLEDLVTALNSTGYSFAHYAWSKAPDGDYGIYEEESGDDLVADGRHVETGTNGYIHFFTRDPSGAPRTAIEAVLNSLCIPWGLDSIQYENDTGYIHYEWSFSVYG